MTLAEAIDTEICIKLSNLIQEKRNNGAYNLTKNRELEFPNNVITASVIFTYCGKHEFLFRKIHKNMQKWKL